MLCDNILINNLIIFCLDHNITIIDFPSFSQKYMKLSTGTESKFIIKEVALKKRISVGDFQINDEERAVINEVLDSGRISEWKKVKEF